MGKVCGAAGAVALAALLLVPGTAAAQQAQLSGTVERSSLPKRGQGRLDVRALNIDTNAFVGAATANARGAYRMTVPPGKLALLPTAVTRRGIKTGLSRVLTAKPGAKRRFAPLGTSKKKLKKKRKAKRKRNRKTARAANINPKDGRAYDGEAVTVRTFDGGASALSIPPEAIGYMVGTDLIDLQRGGAGCSYTFVAWGRERQIATDEIELQKSEFFDKSTTIEPGHTIDPEAFVDGTVSQQGSSVKISARLIDASTGAIRGATEVVTQPAGLFAVIPVLAQRIARDLICATKSVVEQPPGCAALRDGGGRARAAQVCVAPPGGGPTSAPGTPPPAPDPPPKPIPTQITQRYSGPISGSVRRPPTGPDYFLFTWSGNVDLIAYQDVNFPPDGAPPGEYRYFESASGSVQLTVESFGNGCKINGTRQVQFPPGQENGYIVVQAKVENPWYRMYLFPGGPLPITVTESGGPECDDTYDLPATGAVAWAYSDGALQSSTARLGESGHRWLQPGGGDFTFNWTMTPQT